MIAAAILTGGYARRFLGRDKSRLVVSRDGRTILDRQLAMLAPLAADILIVTSAARLADFTGVPGARAVADAHPGAGPLGAILTALDAADADAVFVIGGDMPDVPAALVAALAARHAASGGDVTAPESVRGIEPLAAMYARSARPALAAAFASGDLSLRHALGRVRLDVMPARDVAAHGSPDRLFRNINSPDDLP
ncbi:MAG TPA: molybdenum cofactor guanylyltransferase [Vicinamibacterales bacterium]|nr:molybdenum cofactor guanylyltransferase [Vicinamibacterales bacterium]